MPGDLFLIDTRLKLNHSIPEAFEKAGYTVKVATGFHGVPDDVLKQAKGFTAIGIVANKKLKSDQVRILKDNGNKAILCCSAGYDNLPLAEIKSAGIRVVRVPAYSPSSIAEYAIASIFAVSKNIQKSYEMTKEANFTIGGLSCLLLEDKVVGVIGTGMIGKKFVQKACGLFKKVVCYDAYPDHKWMSTIDNAEYVEKDVLFATSDVISIHVPFLPETRHLINAEAISKMKQNVIIVNTSRGGIVNTHDLVEGLKSKKIFGVVLDVFEREQEFMFKDMRQQGFDNYPELKDLTSMHNVIISSHIAFYTEESIKQITLKTLANYEGILGKKELEQRNIVA